MFAADTDAAVDDASKYSSSPLAAAFAGVVALTLGLGLGRFVFTPVLPMMLHDGTLTLKQGGMLATANYVGYLLGALFCILIRPDPGRAVRMGLVLVIVLTAAMALPGGMPAWVIWRTVAGICCAIVMVYSTAWCLQRLAELGRPTLGGLMFCGCGVGIVITGVPVFGMVAANWPASWAWIAFSVIGVLTLLPVWSVFGSPSPAAEPSPELSPAAANSEPNLKLNLEACALTFAFGLAGFGYVITATFLPVIARQAMPGSMWVDLFWPIFVSV